MRRNKYAVIFPGFVDVDSKSSPSIFSETAVAEREKTIFKAFHALDSLAGFAIQRSRTSELEKQLSARKQALDTEIDNGIEQLKIQYEEESKQLRIKIENERQKMDFELQKLKMETAQRAKEFSFSYEEYMKSNQRLKTIINSEKAFLEEAHRYIEALGDVFSNRKEYIIYCDLERKCLESINEYLKYMI